MSFASKPFEEFCEMWKVRPHSKKIKLVRLWGGIYNDNVMAIARSIESLAYPVILITTNQTLKNLFSKTCFDEFVDKTYLAHTILSHIDLLVIDEAHHASANTYQYILDRICEYQSQEKLFKKQCKFLGMTATPFRNEDNPVGNLQKIFSKIIFPFRTLNNKSENPDSLSLKNELQKQNILAQEEYLTWNTDFRVKIENEKDYENEFATQIDKSLGRHHRRILIAQKIEELFKQEDNPLILYFGATVDDAKMISCLLNMKNIDAALVTGLTTPRVRNEIIQSFRKKEIKVLCNCRVLTTGFDAPQISHVVMGWQTSSPVLFSQMVGRGLRGPEFGGTSLCKVIQVKDKIEGFVPRLAVEEYIKMWRPASFKKSA